MPAKAQKPGHKKPGRRKGGRPTGLDARAEIDARREQVAKMRFERVPTRLIAERLGVAKSTVDDDIAALRAAWKARYADATAEWIEDETAEIEHYEGELYAAWAASVDNGEPDARLIEAALKFKARKHQLRGLDRPTKIAPVTPDGDEPYAVIPDDALERQLRKLLGDGGEA